MTLAEAAARYRFPGPEDRKKAFRRAIDADPDQKIFNDQFVDGLSRQVDRATATLERIDSIGWALLLYLAATVLSLHFPISAFGFSFKDSKNARELLLIVWFSLHFYRTTKFRDQTYCRELLECLLERRAGNNPITLNAMTIRYGIESNPFQLAQPDAQPSLFKRLLLIGYTLLAFG